MSSESDFLDWIRSQHKPAPMIALGPGDDLAVVNWAQNDLLLAGADQVLDGVHFDSSRHTPKQIGRKAMNRNLSDCAAMAALPTAAIATVALPRGAGIDYAKELYLGLQEAGEAYGCPIIGGDTASWDGKLALSVAILARADGIKPITRAGAKAGDGIYVTGPLGGSIQGRHMTFTPRVREARELARTAPISAMIDISDGLSRDLARICHQSDVGALIEAAAIPIHADAIELSKKSGRSPLEHALHDGEDHELLFTCATHPPAGTLIGKITADRSLLLLKNHKTEPLSPGGWDYSL